MNNSILIIDIDESFVNQCKEHLESLGIDLIVSHDGVDGLNKAREINPAIVLLDIKLPFLDGYHLCKLLKGDEEFQYIPVVFVSSTEDPEDILNTKRVGGDLFLRKPIDMVHLTNELITLLSPEAMA